MLVVGGGGGGGSGHNGGGGAGFVNRGVGEVNPGESHIILVSSGGSGAVQTSNGDNSLTGNTDGGDSKFSNLLVAAGGKTPKAFAVGGNGGSGGGTGGYACGASGHAGGTNGGNGGDCFNPNREDVWGKSNGGIGQGSFLNHLKVLENNVFSAGAGGPMSSAERDSARVGSGGGGVQMNGEGPRGQDGVGVVRGTGGNGYGGGGGCGGFDLTSTWTRLPGGNGGGGVVYVEWD